MLSTYQVNTLADIGRRLQALSLLVAPVRLMADTKWDDPLDEVVTTLDEAVWAIVDILQPAMPGLGQDGLAALDYRPDVELLLGQVEAERLAEIGRTARLRSHRLHPLLVELPENSTTFIDARKIVDRLVLHAGELLHDYVRLVDPSLATSAAGASERG